MENNISVQNFSLDLIALIQNDNLFQEGGIKFAELEIFKTDQDLADPQKSFNNTINSMDIAYSKAAIAVRHPASVKNDDSHIAEALVLAGGLALVTAASVVAVPAAAVTVAVTVGSIISAQALSEIRDKTGPKLKILDDKMDMLQEEARNLNEQLTGLYDMNKVKFAEIISQNTVILEDVKAVQRTVDKNQKEVLLKIDQQTADLEVHITKGVTVITQQASENTAKILNGLDKIETKIDTNISISSATYQVTTSISGEVDSIGKYLFLQMPLSLQAKILEGSTDSNGNTSYELNFIKNLSLQKRDELKKETNQYLIKQKTAEGFQKGLEIAGAALKIAEKLGLPPEIAKFGANMISVADSIGKIVVSSLLPPNVFGIVKGVVSFIGSIFGFFGGEDEEMKAMRQIQESIHNMHKDMVKGFNALQELAVQNQKQLLQYMEYQTQLIQNGFKQLASRLAQIEKKQDDLLYFILNLVDESKGAFRKYSEELRKTEFKLFEDYVNFCADFTDFVKIVLPETAKRLADDEASQVYFDYQMAKNTRNTDALRWVDSEYEIYKPARDLFYYFFSGSTDEFRNAVNALFFPVLKTKDNLTLLWEVNQTRQKRDNDSPRLLEKDSFYNPESITFFSDLFLRVAIFFDIEKYEHKPYPTLSEFLEEMQRRPERMERRNNDRIKQTFILLHYTNRALVQQTLLSGFLVLQPIYYALLRQTTDEKSMKLIQDLFKGNYLAATNFAILLLGEALEIDQPQLSKFDDFELGYNNKDFDILNGLSTDIRFTEQSGRIVLSFRNINFACPEPEQVKRGEMIYSASVNDLMHNKARLEEKLIILQMGNTISYTIRQLS